MDNFFAFLFGAGVSGIFWGVFLIEDTESYYEYNAVQRGYALYCPLDGEFAWKGECKES